MTVRSAVAVFLVAVCALSPRVVPTYGSRSPSLNPLGHGWSHVTGNVPVDVSSGQVVHDAAGLLLLAPVAAMRRGASDTGTFSSAVWSSRDGRYWKSILLDRRIFHPGEMAQRVIVAGSRVLLLGGWRLNDAQHRPEIVIWSSVDGSTWRRSQVGVAGLPFAYVSGVGALGSQLVAVGFTSRPPLFVPTGLIWTSTDGMTWHRLTSTGNAFARAGLTAVARGGPGLVAAGSAVWGLKGRTVRERAAIWISRDGTTWHRVPDGPGIFGTDSLIVQLVAGPHGLLALGESSPRSNAPTPLLWVSPDGLHWQRVAHPPFLSPSARYLHLTVEGGAFVAIINQDDESVLWSSRDGRSWSRLGGDELFGGTARISALAAFRDSLAAVGTLAPHPSASCTNAPLEDLQRQSYNPATFLWTPKQSRAAPTGRPDPLDPKTFRLRAMDLPVSVRPPDVAGLEGAYVDLCGMVPTLGRHRAYKSYFLPYGSDETMVSQSTGTGAATLRHPAGLLRSLLSEVGAPATIVGQTEQRAPTRIGRVARLFSLRAKQIFCDGGRCTTKVWNGSAVVWQEGRRIGAVFVAGRGSVSAAVRLAHRQWAHVQHTTVTRSR